MKELFEKILASSKADQPAVMVTVIAESGSTPRGLGARMLIGKEGRLCGTIGGGAVEYKAEQLAKEAVNEGRSYTKSFTLRRNEVEDLGMICGGNVGVYFQYITPSKKTEELMERILDAFSLYEDTWLITDISSEESWRMDIYTKGSSRYPLGLGSEDMEKVISSGACQTEAGGHRYFTEPLAAGSRVLVFGGGHIAQELIPVLTRIDFRCVVFEDRADFARPELFPGAEQVIQGDFEKISDSLEIRSSDYVVVLTRGHAFDYNVQEQVLRNKTAYVGVVGSKTKVAAVQKRLLEAGVSKERIAEVHSPIGLKIGAKSPSEIAISIAGELIQIRAELAPRG